jgi:hypothetical protein
MNFDDPTEGEYVLRDNTDVGSGRMTMVHEIGHQLGLAHSGGFNVMNTDRRPTIGGSWGHAGPMPDDVAGVAELYGVKQART